MNKTAEDIEIALARHFDTRRNLMIPNASWGFGFRHEIDLLMISKSGYVTEIEIKVSKYDLKRDQKKQHGHGGPRIKAVYFAMPSAMARWIEFVPKDAGVLVVTSAGKVFEIAKPKRNMNARPFSESERVDVLRGLALRYWDLKRNIWEWRTRQRNIGGGDGEDELVHDRGTAAIG